MTGTKTKTTTESSTINNQPSTTNKENNMSDQSIIEKVQAILARANHPNTPQAEAETALAMAHRLITKHNLDESALSQAQESEDIVSDKLVITGAWAVRRRQVAYTVARKNSCDAYQSTHWKDNELWKKDGFVLHIYGTKADIFAVKTIWSAVEALALRTIPKEGDRSFKTSWWYGFRTGIDRALTKANREVVNDIVAEGGSSLVLVDRLKRAENEMRAQVAGLRTTKSSYGARSSGGYSAGVSAGSSFSSGGIGRGSIGALGR